MGAVEVSTDPVSDLLGAEQPCWLDDGTLAMHTLGLNRVEPRTFDRQVAGHDPHALPLLLDCSVVGADPGADPFADMPGGVIPDQHPHAGACRMQSGAAPRQELLGDGAHRLAIDEAQPHALLLAPLAQQHAIAGQRLRVGIGLGKLLLDQAQGAIGGVCPAVQLGASQPAPPGLIGEAQHPIGLLSRQSNQAVALPFFRAYAGSGLVIQCLARSQLIPSRSSACRMVSPLTRRATIPWATLTSAATSSFHTLVGSANARGQRCKTAPSRSPCSAPLPRRLPLRRDTPS